MSVMAERLKETRKNLNVPQKKVAESIGLSERLYQSYEYGATSPQCENLTKLCLFFNVSADYLLGLTDEPRPLNGSQQTNDLRSIEMLPSTSPKQISFVITVPVNSSLVASEN